MAANPTPPRPATPIPPASRTPESRTTVVPIRPKPPAFPALTPVTKPIVIEEDVVEYLVKASVQQRWRILTRVAAATADEVPFPEHASTLPPPPQERASTQPPPASPSPPPPAPAPAASASAGPAAPAASAAERASSVPPPPPASQRRPLLLVEATPVPPPASIRAAEQAEDLFEAMHGLTLFESAPAGARFCLEAALRAVPCLAGLVHLRDPGTRELVVVHAQGPRAEKLLRTRTQDDALAARATLAGKPLVVTYGSEPGAEKMVVPRHAFFDPWSAVVVPVMHGGQLLALLELIDPVDGAIDEDARSALGYVALRLGAFLAENGTELG